MGLSLFHLNFTKSRTCRIPLESILLKPSFEYNLFSVITHLNNYEDKTSLNTRYEIFHELELTLT